MTQAEENDNAFAKAFAAEKKNFDELDSKMFEELSSVLRIKLKSKTNRDYNHLFKLIAKSNTWFKEGTEVLIDDGILDDLDNPGRELKITFEEIKNRPDRFLGMMVGIRVAEDQASEGKPVGYEHIDGEPCSLDEFYVTQR